VSASRFAFVLVEPLQPGNVGAAARAMKNGGFRDLRLVGGPRLDGEAEKMAWKSLDVLRAAKRFDSLAAAVADCRLIVAFSSRPRRSDRPLLEIDEALPRLAAAARASRSARIALLFGREDRGLTREELASAQYLIRIDAAKERQVYNLSQAVLIAAYSLRRALAGAASPPPVASVPPLPGRAIAPRVAVLPAKARTHLRDRIAAALAALGYREMKDEGLADRILARSDRLLDRADPDASDLAMFLGILRRIEGRTTGTAPRAKPRAKR
jgi:TrmH family RNA methyltransferase